MTSGGVKPGMERCYLCQTLLGAARSRWSDGRARFCARCRNAVRNVTKAKWREVFREGCTLSEDSAIFTFILKESNFFPCDECNCQKGCRAFGQILKDAKASFRGSAEKARHATVKDGVTNAQIAQVLDISKRQASRLRAEGKVDLDRVRRELNAPRK